VMGESIMELLWLSNLGFVKAGEGCPYGVWLQSVLVQIRQMVL